ncbi:MAG: alpha/beta hydrolase [Deltaproteobacteria bacterium]|jgi:pimeloyl-ACP methyl ester carboxylesterase|nr:alpha/beta hydrolase [Deltaproteobacteria bacterium]
MSLKSSEKKNISSRIFHVNTAGCRFRIKSIHPHVDKRKGNRPNLIFLHEGLGCIELWRDFPEILCLSTDCSGFVYDRIGYGESEPFEDAWPLDYLEKEALRYLPALLKTCDITDVILIGHSDGGTIALIAASIYNHLVRGIITEAAHIFVEDITLSGIRNAVKDFESTSLKEKLARYHKENTEMIFYRWVNRWLSTEFYNWNIEEYLPKITCPVLALQGEDDEYGTPAQIEGIANLVSGPVYPVLIPKCGHVPHFQAKRKVLYEMTRFIKSCHDFI